MSRRYGVWGLVQPVLDRPQCGGVGGARRQRADQLDDRPLLLADRTDVGLPRPLADALDLLPCIALKRLQFTGRGDTLADQPLSHFPQAVEVTLPLQSVTHLIPLVAARGGVTLRLCQLRHVDDRRHVLPPSNIGGLEVGLQQGRIVPTLHGVDVEPFVRSGLTPEAAHQLVEILLRDLVYVGD